MASCDMEIGKCFKDGEWIPITDVGQLKTGDLVETPSMFPKKFSIVGGIVFPLVNHYGVYLEVDGKPMVAHNPFCGYPEIIPLDEFESGRKVERVIRTNLDSEYIQKKFDECKHLPYDFFGFNCEKFIEHVCQCPAGFLDQRIGWLLFLVAIILILVIFRKPS